MSFERGSFTEQGSVYYYTQALPSDNMKISFYSDGKNRKTVLDWGKELRDKLLETGYELLSFGNASLWNINYQYAENKIDGFDWVTHPDGSKHPYHDGADNGVMDMIWNGQHQIFKDLYGYQISDYDAVVTPAFIIKGEQGIRELGEPLNKTNRMVMLRQIDGTVTFIAVDRAGLNKTQLKTLCDKWHSVTACAFDGGGSVRMYVIENDVYKLLNKATDDREVPNIWYIARKIENEVDRPYTTDLINGLEVKAEFISKSNNKAWDNFPMNPSGITVHNTGNVDAGADAHNHSQFLDSSNSYVSYHFIVDDKNIIQKLPLDVNGWHAGDGADGEGNRSTIAIELCENSDGDWSKTRENAIALIKHLMKTFNLDESDVYKHHDWSGKDCPHIIISEGWDEFISDLSEDSSIIEELENEIAGYQSEIYELNQIINSQNVVMNKLNDKLNRIGAIINE